MFVEEGPKLFFTAHWSRIKHVSRTGQINWKSDQWLFMKLQTEPATIETFSVCISYLCSKLLQPSVSLHFDSLPETPMK